MITVRDTARGPISSTTPACAASGLHAVGLERGQQLAQEQRVAAGRLVAGGAERLVGLRAEPLAHERRARPRRSAAPGGRRPSTGRGRSRRAAPRRSPARRCARSRRRGSAGPRAAARGRRGSAATAGRTSAGRRPPAPAGRSAARLSATQNSPCSAANETSPSPVGRPEHRGGGRGGAGQQRSRARVGDHALEQLAHDAERELALELGAAGGEHARAAVGRRAGAPRRAACSCRCPPAPRSTPRGPRPAGSGVEQRRERGDLALALDELRASWRAILCARRPADHRLWSSSRPRPRPSGACRPAAPRRGARRPRRVEPARRAPSPRTPPARTAPPAA